MNNEAVQFEINGTIVELNDATARQLAGSKYTLPQGGIPLNDLADEVKSGLHSTIPASAVTTMTGYQIAGTGSAILSGDTLNQAIGKLEKMIDDLAKVVEDNELVAAASLTDIDNRLK